MIANGGCLNGAILTDELIRQASEVSRHAQTYRAQCSEVSAFAYQLSPGDPLTDLAPIGANDEAHPNIPGGQGHE